jgi:hypothetical protein
MRTVQFKLILIMILLSSNSYVMAKSLSSETKVAQTLNSTLVYIEPQTQIRFPTVLAELHYSKHSDYQTNHPQSGVKIQYQKKSALGIVLEAELSIYPPESQKMTAETSRHELAIAERELYNLETSTNYKNVERIQNQPPQIKIGQRVFQYAMLTFLKAGIDSYNPVITEFFITDYQHRIVKIRLDSFADNQQNSVDDFIRNFEHLLKD